MSSESSTHTCMSLVAYHVITSTSHNAVRESRVLCYATQQTRYVACTTRDRQPQLTRLIRKAETTSTGLA